MKIIKERKLFHVRVQSEEGRQRKKALNLVIMGTPTQHTLMYISLI